MKNYQLPTTNYQSDNSAFTLIEFAIVIVIIGLIASGVIGANSLINSAKRSELIIDYNNFKTVINAFQLEYDALPGDMDDAQGYWSDICNGDGDRKIDMFGSLPDDSQCSADGGTSEMYGVWPTLSRAGFMQGFNILKHGVSTFGSHYENYYRVQGIPASPYDNSGYNLYSLQFGDTHGSGLVNNAFQTDGTLGIVVGSIRTISYSRVDDGPFISPEDARAIDKKIDDGHASKNKVIAGALSDCVVRDTTNGYNYDLSDTSNSCSMFLAF